MLVSGLFYRVVVLYRRQNVAYVGFCIPFSFRISPSRHEPALYDYTLVCHAIFAECLFYFGIPFNYGPMVPVIWWRFFKDASRLLDINNK